MHILLIEDNSEHAVLVRRLLDKRREDIQLTHVESLQDGLRLLELHERVDAILLDLSLPDSQGPEGVLKIDAVTQDVPIVVLTSLDDEQTALEALEDGAQDYLAKDRITPGTLMRSISYAIQRHAVTVENRRLVRELEEAHRLLKRKNKRLRKLYKTAQQFVDNVSHEFRTPLTVIKEYASLIRDGVVGPVNDEQDRMLDVVEDRADDLNTMVDDMLDVSKLGSGVMGIWRRSCQLEDIIDHVRPALERKATVKDVTLTVHVEEDLPAIYCDEGKIGRVITNLVVNAIKFSGNPGTVELSVELDELKPQVVVSVTDNGHGIDQAGVNEIFHRFKQLGVKARGSCKGFGLGLNIAKELVDLNFGAMRVASQIGEGSTFSFTIPLSVPFEVISRYLERLAQRRRDSMVAIMIVEIDEDVEEDVASDVDSFLNYAIRSNDLLFQTGTGRWLLVAAVPRLEVQQITDRLNKVREDANRNQPFQPLPEMELNTVGCWSVREDRARILEAADMLLVKENAASLA